MSYIVTIPDGPSTRRPLYTSDPSKPDTHRTRAVAERYVAELQKKAKMVGVSLREDYYQIEPVGMPSPVRLIDACMTHARQIDELSATLGELEELAGRPAEPGHGPTRRQSLCGSTSMRWSLPPRA